MHLGAEIVSDEFVVNVPRKIMHSDFAMKTLFFKNNIDLIKTSWNEDDVIGSTRCSPSRAKEKH